MSLVLQEISKQYIATNNGLEQVYQNRLVEGRDFERWDWLKATIPLNTTMMRLDISGDKQEWKVKVNKVGNVNLFSTNTGYSYFVQGNINAIKVYDGKTTIINKEIAKGGLYDIELSESSFFMNNNKVSKYGKPITLHITNNINGGQEGIMSISDIIINDIVRYSPCKLLTPCPANLSANGKAYPIGECGMIDSISGKFYGNSGSGSFSVYNDPIAE